MTGSSRGVSISACLRKTLPRQARHSIRSKAGMRSLRITPATNLNIHKNNNQYENFEIIYRQERLGFLGIDFQCLSKTAIHKISACQDLVAQLL